jgi:hypothetical protein
VVDQKMAEQPQKKARLVFAPFEAGPDQLCAMQPMHISLPAFKLE